MSKSSVASDALIKPDVKMAGIIRASISSSTNHVSRARALAPKYALRSERSAIGPLRKYDELAMPKPLVSPFDSNISLVPRRSVGGVSLRCASTSLARLILRVCPHNQFWY